MQNLGPQIDNFCDLMKAKGYDGYFMCNSTHPGKLEQSLFKHLLGQLQGDRHIPPFYLTTYSQWKDEYSPYTQCDFKVRYDQTEGFQVQKMDITRGNQYGKIKQIEVIFKTNEEILKRENAHGMVARKKNRMKI